MINKGLKINNSNNILLLHKYFSNNNNFEYIDNLYKKYFTSKDSSILYELEVLENEIQILLEKKEYSKEEQLILNNVKEYYNSRVNNNTLYKYYLTSPIFNNNICFKKIFNIKNIFSIANNKMNQIKVIETKINNFLNDIRSPLYEIYILNYLSSNYVINKHKKYKKLILNKLLSKEKQNYYELLYVLKYYHNNQSIVNKYETCKLYFDNKVPCIDDNGNIQTLKIDKINGGEHFLGIIIINSDRFNSPYIEAKKISPYIETTLHESWHYKQLYDFHNNKITIEALAYLIDGLVYRKKEDYYKDYCFLPLECQAFKQSIVSMLEILKEHPNIGDINYYKNCISKMEIVTSYCLSSLNPDMAMDKFLIQELENKLKTSPLTPLLSLTKLFFNVDGKVKDFKDLVLNYKKNPNFELFYPFFTYKIKEALPINEDKIIIQMINKEFNYLQYMINGYKYFEEYYNACLKDKIPYKQNELIYLRINRIQTYKQYIKDKSLLENINNSIIIKESEGITLK